MRVELQTFYQVSALCKEEQQKEIEEAICRRLCKKFYKETGEQELN